MLIKNQRYLSCGCCGQRFKTWEGYVDQDQDKGYGICKPCQSDVSDRNEAEFDKAIAIFRDALNEENRVRFDTFDRDTHKAIIWKALDDGILKFKIGSSA